LIYNDFGQWVNGTISVSTHPGYTPGWFYSSPYATYETGPIVTARVGLIPFPVFYKINSFALGSVLTSFAQASPIRLSIFSINPSTRIASLLASQEIAITGTESVGGLVTDPISQELNPGIYFVGMETATSANSFSRSSSTGLMRSSVGTPGLNTFSSSGLHFVKTYDSSLPSFFSLNALTVSVNTNGVGFTFLNPLS
jgi:hypothetical protein